MSRASRWGALAAAGVLTLAAVGVALLAGDPEDEEASRWRARALEAEAQVGALRQRVQALEAQAARRDARETPLRPAAREAAPTAAAQPPPRPVQEPVPEPDPEAEAAWDALVGGALQQQARERLGRELSPASLDRLLGRLGELREAAVALEAPEGDASQAALRARLQRSIVLVETDLALREELGMGMGELLGALDPGAVEEVGPGAVEPDAVEEVGPGSEDEAWPGDVAAPSEVDPLP